MKFERAHKFCHACLSMNLENGSSSSPAVVVRSQSQQQRRLIVEPGVETFLWLSLSILAVSRTNGSSSSVITLLHVVTRIVLLILGYYYSREEGAEYKKCENNGSTFIAPVSYFLILNSASFWRNPASVATTIVGNDDRNNSDGGSRASQHANYQNHQGIFMSIVLVPTLLQALGSFVTTASREKQQQQQEEQQSALPTATVSGTLDHTYSSFWELYALTLSLLYTVQHIYCIFHCHRLQADVKKMFWRSRWSYSTVLILPILFAGIAVAIIYFPILQVLPKDGEPLYSNYFYWIKYIDGHTLLRLLFFGTCCASAEISMHWLQPAIVRCVFTIGEWRVLTSLIATATTEWLFLVTATLMVKKQTQLQTSADNHRFVALSGFTGCCLACVLVNRIIPKTTKKTTKNTVRFLSTIRVAILAIIPLCVVELVLTTSTATTATTTTSSYQDLQQHFPRSLHWLAQFLGNTEEPVGVWPRLPAVPRYYYILYWIPVVIAAISLAPATAANSEDGCSSSVVVTRKWFHLVACLLFFPVTMQAPDLQSLAYAVSVSLLLILEYLRVCHPEELPDFIDDFYRRYLDPSKDFRSSCSIGANSGCRVVISHVALIAGCAAPLWIAECAELKRKNNTSDVPSPASLFAATWQFLLVSSHGITILGIGDSMGALVGTHFGRTAWGANRRTMEGSAAMFFSYLVVNYVLFAMIPEKTVISYHQQWIPTLLFCTLLEAFTVQIDNLVLPLAGSTVLLLLLKNS